MKLKFERNDYVSLSVGDITLLLNSKNKKNCEDKVNFNLWKSELKRGATPIVQMCSSKVFEYLTCLSSNQKFFLLDTVKETYVKLFNQELAALRELGRDSSDMYFVLDAVTKRIENCDTIKHCESFSMGNCKITPIVLLNDLFTLLIESPTETVLWADALLGNSPSFECLIDSLKNILKGKLIDRVVVGRNDATGKTLISNWKEGFNRYINKGNEYEKI